MNPLKTLIKREYWEQSSLFFKVPLALAVIITLAAFSGLILTFLMHGSSSSQWHWYADTSHGMLQVFEVTASPFIVVLWLTLFYYFVSTLYDDRKDHSVLFWQSMPISQWQSVLAKVVAGVIVAPLFAWFTLVMTQLILLIFASVFMMAHPVIEWTSLWNWSQLLFVWLKILAVMMVQAIWLLPLFAWCMLWSAYAKKMPSLSALVSLLVIVIVEWILLPAHYIGHFILSRFTYAASTWSMLGFNSHHPVMVDNYGLSFVLGLVVAVILLACAAALRSRCYDFDR